MGLILAASDVAQLAAGKHAVEVSWFYALLRKNAGWAEVTPPIPDRSGHPVRADGWRVAVYNHASAADGARGDIGAPIALKIAPTNLYVRNMDVAAFAECIQSGRFVEDLIIDGKVVENLPEYVSGKLREMFYANRLYWRNHLNVDRSEKERRRPETKKYLQEDFLGLCDKKSNPDSLLDFAVDACDPSSVPATQRLGTSSVTPSLQAMLTAAKLFWSPHLSYEKSAATYPAREAIEAFMRFAGIRNKNEPSSASTIIRPETVTTPAAQEGRLATLIRRRQASGP